MRQGSGFDAGHEPAHWPAACGPMAGFFADPVTTAVRLRDGSSVLRSGIPLHPYADSMAGMFRTAAALHPGRVLVAQREASGWRQVTYEAACRQVDGLA